MENTESTNLSKLNQEEKEGEKKGKKLIQKERTRTAFERLQLAWIRSSLTLIAIGIGSIEYYHNRIESGKTPFFKLINGNDLGFFLIVTAFFMLFLSTFQHIKSMSTLKDYFPEMRYSVATVLSVIIIILVIFLFIMMFLNFL
ncbi:DUF202 domain-containing protein [Shivajiella indica]|uniref:DUF202 domain-containing protein n=1 Tax=Shivajiella indica TaxID=872115 RepID=A0ABW5B8U0_9BACT